MKKIERERERERERLEGKIVLTYNTNFKVDAMSVARVKINKKKEEWNRL